MHHFRSLLFHVVRRLPGRLVQMPCSLPSHNTRALLSFAGFPPFPLPALSSQPQLRCLPSRAAPACLSPGCWVQPRETPTKPSAADSQPPPAAKATPRSRLANSLPLRRLSLKTSIKETIGKTQLGGKSCLFASYSPVRMQVHQN